MFEQDIKEFSKMMVRLGEFYGKPFTPAVFELYWNVLKPYKINELKEAIRRHIENLDVGKFLPAPADIISAIDGSPRNQALLAWTKMVYAVRHIGRYDSLAFDDPLIHKVIEDMGGWRRFCYLEEKQTPFIEKEFCDRYRGYVSRKPLSHPSYLKGTIEMLNSAHGYTCPSPVLIGNVQKAKEVIATGKDKPFLEISTERTKRIEKNSLKELAIICSDNNKEIKP